MRRDVYVYAVNSYIDNEIAIGYADDVDLYAVTWSPKPYEANYKYQLYHYGPMIDQFLRRQLGLFVAELNKNGQIHFHGTINLQNKYSYYRNLALLKKNGFVVVKRLKNYEEWTRWHNYLKKEVDLTSRLLRMEAIFLCDLKSKPYFRSLINQCQSILEDTSENTLDATTMLEEKVKREFLLPKSTDESIAEKSYTNS